LRSYQLESVNWLIESWYNGRNVILADEMGLGKTIQSIAFLNYLFSFQNMKGPFLVVAPLSTLQHWKRTVEDWSTMNCVLYYDQNGVEGRMNCRNYEWYTVDISMKGTLVQSSEITKFNVLITSYEVFLQDINNTLINLPFQHIIIDEAHRLKNHNAKILTSLKRLPCERILLLTGTPIQNNTMELWTLLNFIEPVKFYSSSKFLSEYGDLSNVEQIDKLHQVLRPYLLRRMKEDVEKSIPPLQETIIDIEMTTIQKTVYKALYENNKGMLLKGSGFNFNTSLNNLEIQLRKCCNHPFMLKELKEDMVRDCKTKREYLEKLITCSGKMILLDKLIEKILKEEGKVLIFSQFTQMLYLIEEYLKMKGVLYERIDGSVKAKERQNSIDRFNLPLSKVNVFLLSTKAGGVGINLTSANVVIIFDSDWNPQNDVQATARAHRIGQENEVKVYRLITKKSYESEMFERASKKLGLDQAIFLGGAFHSTSKTENEDGNLKKLNKNEIEILLKKGIMGLLDNDTETDQAEQDIDEIIKNSRVAKYSLINGSYSFSKTSFTAKETDQTLQMDDPNFWSLVFKNTESECERFFKTYNEIEDSKSFADLEVQKRFMTSLMILVNKLIEAKMKVDGYSVDDENKLNEILTKITCHQHFHKNYKDVAYQMIMEIQKPSRRCKNIDISKLDISLDVKRTKKLKRKDLNEEAMDEEDSIFKEGSEDEENIFTTASKPSHLEKRLKKKPKTEDISLKVTIPRIDATKPEASKEDGAKKRKPPLKKPEAEHTASPVLVEKSAKEKKKAVAPTNIEKRPPKSEKKQKASVPLEKEGKEHSKIENEIKEKEVKLPVILKTYTELGLEAAIMFDFSFYKKDWCRYCGARYTTKFMNGPWGDNCLCLPHYEMYKKRSLKLSKKEYPELSAPIDIDKNTELAYLSSIEDPQELQQILAKRKINLADLRPSKR
jgi:chromodomain-helicase-DNA-binding protein 7